MATDQNFDELSHRFTQKIYSGTKGKVRLALLERDLDETLGQRLQAPLSILDAGGGQGQFARILARQGHQVTLCDHSAVMLESARQGAAEEGLDHAFEYIHSTIQALPEPKQSYDLVLCHAVLEWVIDWQALVLSLLGQMGGGGYLSLMFYNQHSTVFRSLVRGYFDRVVDGKLHGNGQGLTPINPLLPEQVLGFLKEQGMTVLCKSGIRVFHDYMHKEIRDRRSEQDIITLEKRFSREEPYRSLGRYYHVVVQRS